ncbi:MAG: YHS domain-containing (seleno)protein [Sneathiellaceae bacterium]
MFNFKTIALAAALAMLPGMAAWAGEQYVDGSGFAVSGYDVVAYFDAEQRPIGSPQPVATPGMASITAEHNGAIFAFASEANRHRFLADPDRYVPQYDGHCAYGAALGGKVPANPHLWRIVDGKLYLNVKDTVVGFWEQDIPKNIDLAETNWTELESKPASHDPVPEFDATTAPVGN